MPASSENRRTARNSRQRLFLSPAVTTMRRGSHRPVVAAATTAAQPIGAQAAVGVSLMPSARGVRLSPR